MGSLPSGAPRLLVQSYTSKWLPATQAAVEVKPNEREVFDKEASLLPLPGSLATTRLCCIQLLGAMNIISHVRHGVQTTICFMP
jgi:hypothetical protein